MRDICDVFMNESEIKLKERIEGGRSKEILSFQFKYDDTMQLIMKKIHEQRPSDDILHFAH
jgi:hypothetical protein